MSLLCLPSCPLNFCVISSSGSRFWDENSPSIIKPPLRYCQRMPIVLTLKLTILHIFGRCMWQMYVALEAKTVFCQKPRDEVMGQAAHDTMTTFALSTQGKLYRSVSLYMGHVTICSVRRAKGAVSILLLQDMVQHALLCYR